MNRDITHAHEEHLNHEATTFTKGPRNALFVFFLPLWLWVFVRCAPPAPRMNRDITHVHEEHLNHERRSRKALGMLFVFFVPLWFMGVCSRSALKFPSCLRGSLGELFFVPLWFIRVMDAAQLSHKDTRSIYIRKTPRSD